MKTPSVRKGLILFFCAFHLLTIIAFQWWYSTPDSPTGQWALSHRDHPLLWLSSRYWSNFGVAQSWNFFTKVHKSYSTFSVEPVIDWKDGNPVYGPPVYSTAKVSSTEFKMHELMLSNPRLLTEDHPVHGNILAQLAEYSRTEYERRTGHPPLAIHVIRHKWDLQSDFAPQDFSSEAMRTRVVWSAP